MIRSLIVSLSKFSILGGLLLTISSCQNPLSETGYSTTDLNVVSFSYKDAYTRGLVRNFMSIAPTNFDDKGFPPNCTIEPALPQGLSISSPDCVISGTPLALMPPTTYTVTALSRAGMSKASLSLSVASSAPMLTYPSHTASRMMVQITINPVTLYDNGSPITNCTVTPALLTGLTLNPNTCVISGATPDYLLYRLYTVTVTNAIGSSESTFSLSVAATPLMSFNGISGAGQISLPFRAQPSVFNTRGEPVTSCTATPALPAGLSINQSTCVISGTPIEVISGTYTVTATNGVGSTNSSILINITPYPPLVTYSMGGFIGYISVPFVATPNLYEINGAPITSCTISPTLPNGLSIDPITCVVSGIPTVSIPQGNYTITVTNSAGVGYGTLPMMILPSVPVLSYAGVSGSGSFGSYLSITPSTLVNNGAWITSCTVSPALPSGLWMDNYTCSIFGTASQVIPLTTFTVTAANSAGVTTAQIPITIAPTPPNLSYEGAVGKTGLAQSPRTIIPRTFNYGGVSLTNCTISPALPTGLSIAPTTCVISGTALYESTTTTYTVTATNVAGTGTATLDISVSPIPPTLSYSASTGTSGLAQNAMSITPSALNQGGTTITNCTIAPALPSGLSINTTTCVISGTPPNESPLTTYTVTIHNSAGTGTATVALKIDPIPPTLSYIGATGTVGTRGVAMSVTPTALNQGGTTITNCTTAPALPSGLSINTTTCVISGTPTVMSPSTNYLVTIHNSAGTGTSSVNITVNGTLSFTEDDPSVSVPVLVTNISSAVSCSQIGVSSSLLVSSSVSGTYPNCSVAVTPSLHKNGSGTLLFTVNNDVWATTTLSFSISAVNDAPVMASISNQSTNEDTSKSVSYSFSDVDSAPDCTSSITVTSSNTTLLPNSSIIKSGTAPNCSLSLSPALNEYGSTNVTVVVTDGALTDSKTFTLTVNPVNDAPVLGSISNTSTNEDTPVSVSYSFVDVDSTLSCTSSMTVTSSNTTLLPNANITKSGTAPNCSLSLSPALNQNGTSTITVVISDGELTDTKSFSLTVNAVNDAPVLAAISNTSTNEDTATSVSYSFSDVDSTPNCTSSMTVTSSNTTLVPNANITKSGSASNCGLSISPALNQNGTSTITVVVTDGALTDTKTFTLTVNAVDDAPVASNVSATINEDVATQVTLSYSDVESNLAATCTLSSPSNLTGTCVCTSGTCQATVTGTSNFNGSASFSYTVTANGLTSNTASASVTISAVNDAPVLAAISNTSTNEDTATSVSYSFSDVDSSPNCSSSITVTSSNTTLVPNANITKSGTAPNCGLSISPALNQNGTSTITVMVSDGALSDTKTFTLTVNAVNDAPVLAAISAQSTNEDTALSVSYSFVDVDSTPNCTSSMTVTSSNTTLLPTANITKSGTAPNCSLSLSPALNLSGTSTITVAISDGALTDTKTFNLTVNAVNDAPVLAAISNTSTNEDISTSVSYSFSDIDSSPNCTSSITVTSSNTTLVPNANITKSGTAPNCSISLSPALNQNGTSTITVVVSDGALTDSKTFTLTVNAVDDAPVASNVSATINEDVATQVTLSYSDVESNQAATCTLSSTSNLTGTCVCTTGTCRATVTGTSNFNGSASFSYTVTANGLTSNAASGSVSISAVDDAPVASNVSGTLTEDTSGQITLSYSDVESHQAATCTLSSLSNLTGTCACTTGTCRATVSGTSNFNGSASFSYTVTANGLTSNAASASVTISAVDDAPVASNVSGTLTEDTSGQITLSYSDVESHQAATCTLSSLSNLTGTCACTTGTCRATVTGTSNFNGSASFNYTVTANGLTSNTASAAVTVSAVDDAPVASNVSATINEDVATAVTLSYSDVDAHQAASCTLSSPSNLTGTCACTSGTCQATVTGTSNYNGAGSFNYTVTANGLTSNTASASITISAVNDIPVVASIGTQTTNEDTSKVVSFTISDVESTLNCSSSVSVTSSSPVSSVTKGGTAPNCTLTVVPIANLNGSSSIGVTVTDGSLSASTSFTFTVTPVDDAPVASNVSSTISEDVAGSITLSYTDSDSDKASTCTLSSLSNLTGTCSCNASTGVCTASVTGTSNYNGVASFSYTVTANSVVSNSATASVTISAVNDAPLLGAISAQTTTENIAKSVTLSVSDVDNSITCTSFISVTSSNTTLLPNANIVRGGTAPGCTLTMTPATSQTGTVTVTVTASDGALSAVQSFVLTVNPNIITISQFSGYRGWSNGTFARTCYEYLNPTGIYQYSGSTGNSTYRIDPDGAGAVSPLDVTCDMANGGWTTISSMRTDAIASASDSGELVTSNVAAFNAIAALSNLQKITYTTSYASGSTTVPGTCQKGIYTSNYHNIYVYTQNGSQCCLAYWWGNPTTWYCPVTGTYCVTSYYPNEGFVSLPTEYGMYPTAAQSYVRLNNAAVGGWDPYCYTPEGTTTTCTYNGVDFKTSSGAVVSSIGSGVATNNTITFGITQGSPARKFTTKSSCSSGGTNGITGTMNLNASTSFTYSTAINIADNGSYKAWSDGTFATSCSGYRNPTSPYQFLNNGDGIYRIDVDGSGPLTPFNVKCDMTSDGGGWTVLIAHDGTYQTTTSILSNYATYGSVSSGIQYNATYGVFWNSSTWGKNANNTFTFSKIVPANQVRITFTGVYGNSGLGGLDIYSNDGTAVFSFQDPWADTYWGQVLTINNTLSLLPLNGPGGNSSLTDLYNDTRTFSITSPLKEISNYYYPGYTNNQRYIRELKVR